MIENSRLLLTLERCGQWKGFMKFGVYTNADLPTLKECLLSNGHIAGRIFSDEKLGIDLLLVIEPERNIIEIISRNQIITKHNNWK